MPLWLAKVRLFRFGSDSRGSDLTSASTTAIPFTDLLRMSLINWIDLTHPTGSCSLNGTGSGSQFWTYYNKQYLRGEDCRRVLKKVYDWKYLLNAQYLWKKSLNQKGILGYRIRLRRIKGFRIRYKSGMFWYRIHCAVIHKYERRLLQTFKSITFESNRSIIFSAPDCFLLLKFRPGSHQTSFQYEELMIDIIKHFKANNDTEALKKLLNISHNHGYVRLKLSSNF